MAHDRPGEFFQPLNPPRAFQVMARGGQTQVAPSHTRPALQLCIEDGLEWVTLEVRRSKDAQHVLFDSDDLAGRASGNGKLADQTLAELQALDAGSWFGPRSKGAKLLSLPEVLALAKDKINLCLVCRHVDAKRLTDEILSAGMQRQVLLTGDAPTLSAVESQSAGKLALMLPRGASRNEKSQAAVVQLAANELSADSCRTLHEQGLRVQVAFRGSDDSPPGWERARAAGVDFLETDRPEELVAHLVSQQLPKRSTQLTCHRGASRYAPENCLAAFSKAALLGADYVEFDVRPSSDGQYYLLHDGNLDRTTDGRGPIRDATSATLDKLDAGSWLGRPFVGTRMPTLEQFLVAVPPRVNLYFDAKDIRPEDLAAALARHGLSERTVVYQGADFLGQLQKLDSRVKLMPPARSIDDIQRLADTLKPFAVDASWRALSAEFVQKCHALGIQVFSDAPFYVTTAGYQQAMAWGVDVIQTDFPLRYWRAMELTAATQQGAKP